MQSILKKEVVMVKKACNIFVIACLFVLMARNVFAEPALTIYNQDFAVVRDHLELDLKKGINDTILYDEEKVKERYGFGPELLPDYKGLCGDASDNIKGVAGIGEKSATELITKFGSIEEIYKKLKRDRKAFEKAGMRERVIGLLESGKEDAEFSKILGTIRRDAPIEFTLPGKPWRECLDLTKAEKLFQELEFRALGERLKAALATPSSSAPLSAQGGSASGGQRGSPSVFRGEGVRQRGDGEAQTVDDDVAIISVASTPQLTVEQVLAASANTGPEDPQEKFICDSCQ